MKLKLTTRAKIKNLGLSFLCIALATSSTNAQNNSPIPKSLEAPPQQTSEQAQTGDEQAKVQDEVVVVGYGTMKKKDITGAVSSVNAKDFNAGVVNSPDQLIQGKASGIQITANSGSPSAASLFTIRGNSSVRPGNQPLFVIDGVIMDGRSAKASLGNAAFPGENGAETEFSNPLLFINPSDIASMEVLKDASATAIYGSRGSNGVVLVTTKKGSKGAIKVEANASLAISNLARTYEVLNSTQYVDLVKNYSGSGQYFPDNSTYNRLNNGVNTDAMKSILRTGITQRYGISISGGSDNSSYRTSIGYSNQDGILLKTGLEKINFNTNAHFDFFNSKKVGLDLSLMANQVNEQTAPILDKAGYIGSIVGHALQWNPTKPLYNTDGSLNIDKGGSEINPLALSNAYDDYAKTNTVIASIAPYVELLPGLTYKMFLSSTLSQGSRQNQISNTINLQGNQASSLNKGGTATVANSELNTSQITHTLNYNTEVSSDLSFNGLLGYEYFKTNFGGTRMSGQGFDNVGIPYYNMLNYSTSTTRQITSFNDPTIEIQSYFARVVMNYKSKYMATITARADGSSKFGTNNKYGFFPSIGLAWVLSNEDFLKGVSEINSLKLRAGWGLTGNQEFPAGSAQQRYGVTGSGAFGTISVFDSSLRWQTDQQINVGLDFALLDSKLSGSVDFFSKSTKDLIIAQTSGLVASGNFLYRNLDANIKNTGIDFALNAALIRSQDVNWSLGLTGTFFITKSVISGIATNKDGSENVIRTGLINGAGFSDVSVERIKNGESLNSFWFATKGTAETKVDAPNAGSPLPTTILGINTNFNYKDITLSASINGAFGQKIYNNSAAILTMSNLGGRNVTVNYAGTVLSATNDKTNPAVPPVADATYLEDGSYLRISNVTIAYNLTKTLNVKQIKGLSVYVTGQNLFVFTQFKGFDPEVNVNKSIDGVPSVGIEYMPYPSARTFVFGLNVNF